MRLRVLLLWAILSMAFTATGVFAAQPQGETANRPETQAPPESPKHTYSLPPEKLQKAIELSRIRVILDFLSSGWGIFQLILLLGFGVVAHMRNIAVNLSKNRWAQGYVFTFLLLLTTSLLTL